jgi:hypothetical protein
MSLVGSAKMETAEFQMLFAKDNSGFAGAPRGTMPRMAWHHQLSD